MPDQTINELRAELLEMMANQAKSFEDKIEKIEANILAIKNSATEEAGVTDAAFEKVTNELAELREDIDLIPKPEREKEKPKPIVKVEEPVTIGNKKYHIKLAKWRDGRDTIIASKIIDDATKLKAQLKKYPSLFVEV